MSDEEDNEDFIQKPGRKGYFKSVPRRATDGYEDRQPPDTYVSHQSRINSNNGKIDEDILEEYLNESGYEEVEPKDIDKLPSGARIAYIRKDNKWCSAGYYSRTEISMADIDGNPFKKPKSFILYKGYNGSAWSVQLEDVEMFYVMKPKLPTPVVKMIYFKKPTEKKTKYPVTLLDNDGYEVVVYYAKDNYGKKVFMNTKKYKRASEDSADWEFEGGGQKNDIEED